MSVIVMGMEIPRDCPACPLSYWANHSTFLGCRAVSGKRYAMQEEQYRKSDTPPDWCPIRPLPEKHGRLIDADALYDALGVSDEDICFKHMLEECQTIVEAEGE